MLILGVLMVVLAVCYDVAARRSRRVTLALADKLHNPDVKRRWIECDQPQCLALELAIRTVAVCVGLLGLFVTGLAIFN